MKSKRTDPSRIGMGVDASVQGWTRLLWDTCVPKDRP
jgi:hypothetical protein